MVDDEFKRRLAGARMTTAEVLYHMPDHPGLLQTFIWQTLDVAPKFPRLHKFLNFWRLEIDAAIHTVRVAHCELIRPAEWRGADIELKWN